MTLDSNGNCPAVNVNVLHILALRPEINIRLKHRGCWVKDEKRNSGGKTDCKATPKERKKENLVTKCVERSRYGRWWDDKGSGGWGLLKEDIWVEIVWLTFHIRSRHIAIGKSENDVAWSYWTFPCFKSSKNIIKESIQMQSNKIPTSLHPLKTTTLEWSGTIKSTPYRSRIQGQ